MTGCSLTRLIIGDGALASLHLEFHIAIIAERCLSQCSFLHLHIVVYVTIIRPSFMGKPLLSHFAMISIIVSYDGLSLSLQFQISLQTNSSSFSFIRASHIYQYSLSYHIISYRLLSSSMCFTD